MIDFDKHFIVKSKFKSLVSVIVEFLLFQYRCVMLQTVLTRAILEYLVCFAYHWHVVCFRCKVPGVMDGDEPRSFVTLYELEGLVYTYRLQLQCCLIFNYSMLLLADVSIPPCMECQSLAAVVWLLISSGQPTVTHTLVAVYISGWGEVLGRCSVLTQ